MKLKDISRLCARSHEICICDMRGAQWLGDGHAMYPVFGLPELDVDTAPAVLDFNEEKAEALDVRNVYLEDRYNMREADDYEEALTGVVLRFLHGGGQLDAWRTKAGASSLSTRYTQSRILPTMRRNRRSISAAVTTGITT